METPPYRLRLEGRVELLDPVGDRVVFKTRKATLLLAALWLGTETGIDRATLATMLWEDSAPDAARASLRTCLAEVRAKAPALLHIVEDRIALKRETMLLERQGGDFMPGFEASWVIDERLQRRARMVEAALALSKSSTSDREALRHAERACEIDPFHLEAATQREKLLRRIGRPADAVVVGETFRSRVLREFGQVVPTPPSQSPTPATAQHPLIVAAEWTLARSPDEACAFLANTQAQWMTLSVDQSLEVHRKVLNAQTRDSRDRHLVEAGWVTLLALNGKLGGFLADAEATYQNALKNRELAIGTRLADALAYGFLSAGEFDRALQFAREGTRIADRRNDRAVSAEALITLGIIELHSGHAINYHRRISKAADLMQEADSPYLSASFQNTLAGSFIHMGKVSEALPHFEACRRFIDGLGSDRLRIWSEVVRSSLHECVGENEAARQVLIDLRSDAAAAGQSAVASVDDALLRLHFNLNDLDLAAESWIRGSLYRKGLGTVPSRFERQESASAVRAIRERLGAADLAAARRRIAMS